MREMRQQAAPVMDKLIADNSARTAENQGTETK